MFDALSGALRGQDMSLAVGGDGQEVGRGMVTQRGGSEDE